MEPQAKIDRSTLLVDKHTEYIKSFTKLWETTDKIEFVATGEGTVLHGRLGHGEHSWRCNACNTVEIVATQIMYTVYSLL